MPTDINTLAKKCGVSKATISRVFTGRAKVSDALRSRVLAAARELDYRPQQVMARDCVAIIVHDIPSPQSRTSFSERLLSSAVYEITKRNLLTEVLPMADIPKLYDGYTKAVLLLLSEPDIERCRPELEKLSMPIITVNKQYDFSSSVNTDHGQGVELALEHLYEYGHRRIAMTVDQMANLAGTERREAYQNFIRRHKLEYLPEVFYGADGPESFDNLRKLVELKPTALIICGEGVALKGLYDLRSMGIRIPEDLSLVTSELTDISCFMTPELTTINQDLDVLAAETTARLLERIRNPRSAHVSSRLPTSLIVRRSVRKL